MAEKEMDRLNVYLPKELKESLVKMAEETGVKQSQLVIIAVHALTAKYEEVGNYIFVDLINRNHTTKNK